MIEIERKAVNSYIIPQNNDHDKSWKTWALTEQRTR